MAQPPSYLTQTTVTTAEELQRFAERLCEQPLYRTRFLISARLDDEIKVNLLQQARTHCEQVELYEFCQVLLNLETSLLQLGELREELQADYFTGQHPNG